MVVIRPYETSSSSPYDVFLSFRGEDTRYTFTDHLYRALLQHGFRTFRDEDEMQKGERLKSELEKAIPQSKSSIIVISENYADSSWCLDELVMILERRRTSGHVVLPVFYHVAPSEVRKQTGTIAVAFEKHKKQCDEKTDTEGKRTWMEKIQGWRSALTEVADLIGHHHVDGYESKFIDKIIKDTKVTVRRTPLHVDPYIIGIDSEVEKINMWLQDGSNNDRVRAVCGMGGIGKTTIAKIVYNQNFESFDGSSFITVTNIGEKSKQPEMQQQLLSDITKRNHGNIHNFHAGLAEIKNLLFSKRVLLVLDDVEEVDRVYDILGRPEWLSQGSKVIITTRHERMLQPHQMLRVEKLTQVESIKLFNLTAFKKDFPPESYTKHTIRAVQICEGLPLALKVLGTSLSRKREDEWIPELTKLESIPQREILEILKISYDSLQDNYDKSLFLDIACFFVGINEDYAIKILEKWDPLVKNRIQNLKDRCLLTIDYCMVLTMHRLIQDMGRKVVQEESREVGERSRLWHHQEVFDVLENETGTEAVKGLTFDVHMLKEAGNHGKKRKYEEFCDKSILSTCASSLKRRFLNFSYGQSVSTTITSQNDVYLRTDAFKSMRKLRLLLLNDVQLAGSFDNFPKGLVWLSWHRFPLKSIPIEFHLEKLVALDLSHSRLEQVWMETPFLGSLKILDLSYSERLARTPNFFGLQNLERLILKGCVSLVEVCESIGNLETLDLLDLQDCRTLRKLPRNIGKLGSLKTLIISGCNIGDFPSEMRNMQSLKVLEADGIFKNLLCISSEEVKWWERIVWPMVAKPRKGPETIWASLPCSLRKLSLARCNLSDESFPMNFVNLPSLSYLNLSYNPIRRLPNLIRSLSSTNCSLDVINCHRLRLLNFNGISITYFRIIAIGCKSLEIVAPLNRKVKFHHLDYYSIVELKDSFEDTTEYFSTNASCKNIQGTYGYGVYSIRLSGNRVPTFTGEKCEGSSSICFTVPFLPARRIKCLNAWCKAQLNYVPTYKIRLSVKIENKTKDLTWINIDDFYVHPELDKYVGWLSRWSLGNQLEAGDEIIITFEYNKIIEVIEECGYKIVYYDQEEEEEEETEKGNTSTIEKSPHHLPPLRLRRADAISVVIEEDPNKDY
ncbi:hypothetical protein LguiA_008143 [Lonicera macranthoides]